MDQIWNLLEQYLPGILTIGLGWAWLKIRKVVNALKELGDFLTTTTVAMGDQQITPEEMRAIKKEGVEALAAFKAIFKK